MKFILILTNLVQIAFSFKACLSENDVKCIQATEIVTMDETAKQENCWVGTEILIKYTNSSDNNSYLGILNQNGVIIKYNGCILKQFETENLKENFKSFFFKNQNDYSKLFGLLVIVVLVFAFFFKQKICLVIKLLFKFIKCQKYLQPTVEPVAGTENPLNKQVLKHQPENLVPTQHMHASMPNIYPMMHNPNSEYYNKLYKPSAPINDMIIFCCCKVDNGDGLCNRKTCTCKKAGIACSNRCHLGLRVYCKNDGLYEFIKQ